MVWRYSPPGWWWMIGLWWTGMVAFATAAVGPHAYRRFMERKLQKRRNAT